MLIKYKQAQIVIDTDRNKQLTSRRYMQKVGESQHMLHALYSIVSTSPHRSYLFEILMYSISQMKTALMYRVIPVS